MAAGDLERQTSIKCLASSLLTDDTVGMLPCSFEAFLEQLLELQESRTIKSTHDLNVFLIAPHHQKLAQ
jgi:hypothetical protein